MLIYTTVRDEFSGWLLETVKPAYQMPVDARTYSEVITLFDHLLKILHPFMPFITEEIWQMLEERAKGESIMVSTLPKASQYDSRITEAFENVKEVVSGIRKIRLDHALPNREVLELFVQPGDKGFEQEYLPVVLKLGNLNKVSVVNVEVSGAASFRVKSTNFYLPLGEHADTEEELRKLNDELNYTKGFLQSVMKKLGNDRFVSGAPKEVVDKEMAKKADAEEKIRILEERIASLKA